MLRSAGNQEALTNAIKHADPNTLSDSIVRDAQTSGGLRIESRIAAAPR